MGDILRERYRPSKPVPKRVAARAEQVRIARRLLTLYHCPRDARWILQVRVDHPDATNVQMAAMLGLSVAQYGTQLRNALIDGLLNDRAELVRLARQWLAGECTPDDRAILRLRIVNHGATDEQMTRLSGLTAVQYRARIRRAIGSRVSRAY
jgi:hypothetical protein